MKKIILALIAATFAFNAHAHYPRDSRYYRGGRRYGYSRGGGEGTALGHGVGSPVWGPFIARLAICAPGCLPHNFNVYRSGHNSCHSQGRAIDVMSLNCGGQIHEALAGGFFTQVVRCMDNYMKVLYHNGRDLTAGHINHAHFSIGCSIPGHPNYW